MRRSLVTLALGLTLAGLLPLLSACATLGVSNPFSNDPLTGGAEAGTSQLLDVPLPAGMQRYTSHGYLNYGANGGREGLETLRGDVDAVRAAQTLFTSLQGQGWQLRVSLRKGERFLFAYEKDSRLAVLNFRRQTTLTILEIWVGARLPDGSALSLPGAAPEIGPAMPGETYPPESGGMNSAPKPGTSESWGGAGGGGVQERSL